MNTSLIHKPVISLLTILSLVTGFLFFQGVTTAFATEMITIICKNKGTCEQTGPDQPFFTATNLVPGQQIARPIKIHNQRKHDHCTLAIKGKENSNTPTQLHTQLELQIFKNSQLLTSYPLAQVITTQQTLFIDTIPENSQQKYVWQIKFAETADNTYQGTHSNFDLYLAFTCDVTPLSTPMLSTPSATSIPTSTPICTENAPKAIPTLTLTLKSATQATLSWTKVPEANRYILNFATKDLESRYENIDLGDASNYTVNSLHPHQDYQFTITPASGCAIGNPSEPQSIYRKSAAAPAFAIQSDQSATTSGQVLGASILNTNSTSKPPFKKHFTAPVYTSVIFIVLLILLILFAHKKHKSIKKNDSN